MFSKCWQYVSITNIWFQKCTYPNPASKGRTETLQSSKCWHDISNTNIYIQLTFIPQMLAKYIQYKYISQKMYIPQPCARRAHRHPPTWIYSANNCGVLFSWGVSVCPSSTGLDHVHFFRYVFLLDIFCQHLWGVVHLGGVCVPFGHRVGTCTFS